MDAATLQNVYATRAASLTGLIAVIIQGANFVSLHFQRDTAAVKRRTSHTHTSLQASKL